MMNEPRTIRPELVAEKIKRLRCSHELREGRDEFESDPRHAEALWFIAWASNPINFAGGLAQLSEAIVEIAGDAIGTPTMARLAGHPWSDADAETIYLELPEYDRARVVPGERDFARRLKALCQSSASVALPGYLADLCENPAVAFTRPARPSDRLGEFRGVQIGPRMFAPWYFADVAQALFKFMDRWRNEQLATIAETEITRQMFRGLSRNLVIGEALRIRGTCQFGKSKAAEAWCRANAGRARFVRTPEGNTESVLWREVARALGLEDFERGSAEKLRERIGFVLDHCGLMLVFDESHYLLPATFGRNTTPRRLDWVRRQIMDRHLPTAFIITPQSYDPALAKFRKTTGYVMEQFDLRGQDLKLPEKLSLDDLEALAGSQLGDLPREELQRIAILAEYTGRDYASEVVRVGKIARLNATEAGRQKPTPADVDAALEQLGPGILSGAGARELPPTAPAAEDPIAEPLPGRRRASADISPAPRHTAPSLAPFEPSARAESLSIQPG